MIENYSFRSAMNGFNRSDVIQYVDKILREKARSDSRIDDLEKEIKLLESDNATLKRIIVGQEERIKSNSKCDDCEVVKVYEARLGAAMLDAKRFSEILVKEANDKAAALFADAFASAEKTSEKAKDISANIAEINNQFDVSFRLLLDNMNILGKSLESFKNDVKATGSMFDFATDFHPIRTDSLHTQEEPVDPTDSSVTSSPDRTDSSVPMESSDDVADSSATENPKEASENPTSNAGIGSVNFDDADEYDIRVDVDV